MWEGTHLGAPLVVTDLDRSVEFYTSGLGGSRTTRWDTYARVELAGASIHLALPGDPTPDKPGVRLVPPTTGEVTGEVVLHVQDCAATYAALLARGVRFLSPPSTPPWGGEVRCFITNPDGHLIELSQVDPA